MAKYQGGKQKLVRKIHREEDKLLNCKENWQQMATSAVAEGRDVCKVRIQIITATTTINAYQVI